MSFNLEAVDEINLSFHVQVDLLEILNRDSFDPSPLFLIIHLFIFYYHTGRSAWLLSLSHPPAGHGRS